MVGQISYKSNMDILGLNWIKLLYFQRILMILIKLGPVQVKANIKGNRIL